MNQQSALDPHGPAAADIHLMTWIMFITGALISLAVFAVLTRAVFRKRDDDAPSESAALRWIVLGGAAFPALVVTALFVYSVLMLSAHAPNRHSARLTIELTGKQWWWQVRYLADEPSRIVTGANEIHIPAGEPVRLLLESTDVIHSFWVPELQGKHDLIPGRTNVMWLEADEAGIYRALCAEFCGVQHAHMALYVVAHEPGDFIRWLRHEAQPARPGAATARGQQTFMNRGCAVCHTIRGTAARGTIGPDLTHFAARHSIAAGTLRNGRGELAGWITDPQGVKPGNHMPRVPVMAAELTPLLDFLQSLR